MGSSPWGSGQSIWGNARQWEVTWICELVSYSLNFNTGEFIRLLQRTKEATLLKVFIDIQSSDHVRPFVTPWTAAYQASLPFTISPNLLRFISIESVMLSNHLILCGLLFLLPLVFLSIRVFSGELGLHIKWPKYWSFSISPSNEYAGLISFRIDWFDLLAVQEFSLAPQFKKSSALSLLYGPSLTSVHDYWKNHSFNYTDLWRQSDVSAF